MKVVYKKEIDKIYQESAPNRKTPQAKLNHDKKRKDALAIMKKALKIKIEIERLKIEEKISILENGLKIASEA